MQKLVKKIAPVAKKVTTVKNGFTNPNKDLIDKALKKLDELAKENIDNIFQSVLMKFKTRKVGKNYVIEFKMDGILVDFNEIKEGQMTEKDILELLVYRLNDQFEDLGQIQIEL